MSGPGCRVFTLLAEFRVMTPVQAPLTTSFLSVLLSPAPLSTPLLTTINLRLATLGLNEVLSISLDCCFLLTWSKGAEGISWGRGEQDRSRRWNCSRPLLYLIDYALAQLLGLSEMSRRFHVGNLTGQTRESLTYFWA